MARKSLLNDIRVMMERSSFFRPIVETMKKTGIIWIIHDIKSFFNCYSSDNQFMKYYTDHKQDFEKAFEVLSDEKSKKTYRDLIMVLSGENPKALRGDICFPQYFPSDIVTKDCFDEYSSFVDCGAYIGDTIIQFNRYVGEKYEKIYAWEPDENNIVYLHKNVRSNVKVEIIPKGAWDVSTELKFTNEGTDKSNICEDGTISISTDTIDRVCRESKITMIKMDIEGAEMNALFGAKEIIRRDKPILAICIYHSYEDYYRIIEWVHNNYVDYKLYVRAHYDNSSEVVMYAIPEWAQNLGGKYSNMGTI